MMRFGLLVGAVLAGILGIGAGAAPQAQPPPGAGISESRVLEASRGAGRVVEGKFDEVRGRRSWSSRGGSGSRLRRERPGGRSCSTSSSRTYPGRERLLAGRGHGARHEPQADHRRARPAPRRRRPGALPGIGTARPPMSKNRDPGCRSGFYVISYANPRTCARSATSSSCPPATPRAASRTASTSGRAARRGATTSPTSARSRPAAAATAARSGSPTSRNPYQPKVFGDPIDLWRNDGHRLLARRPGRRRRGIAWVERPRRHPRLRHARPARDPFTNPCARPRRWIRSSWPAAASRGVNRVTQPVMTYAQLGPPDRRLGPRRRRRRRATS